MSSAGHLRIDKALFIKKNCTFHEGLTDIKSIAALFFFQVTNRGILALSNKALNVPSPQGAVKLHVFKVSAILLSIQTPDLINFRLC